MIVFVFGVVVGLFLAWVSVKVGELLAQYEDWRCHCGWHDDRPVGEPNLAIANQWIECRRCGRVEVDGP